jgi:uncharacterized protein (DUF58 family)
MLRRAALRLVSFTKGVLAKDRIVYRCQVDQSDRTVRVNERAPLAALAVLLGLLAVFPSRAWLVTVVAVILLCVACFWWSVQIAQQVSLERLLRHTWTQVGDYLEETFLLRNGFSLPILAVEIEDQSTLPGYNASTVRAANGRSSDQWNKKATSTQRGIFRLGPTTLRMGDPLGLFEITCRYPQAREVMVAPPVLHGLSVIAPSGGGHGATTSRQRNLIETGIIGGVRGYHPGDPVRRIHWPLSSRHQSLLVKDFDDEKGGDIWLALDLDEAVHTGQGQESTLEYAIIWAASWAWHLLKQGKGVGLYTSAPERIVIPPAGGTAQINRILRALAPLNANADIRLSALLRETRPFLAHGHSLIVITPSTDADWPVELAQPDFRAAVKGVVLLDVETFKQETPEFVPGILAEERARGRQPLASSAESERLGWLRAMLARMGVPVYLVQHQKILDARPSAPGTGNWGYIVTPWGRVVVRSSPAEVNA